jgi:hypothetical protein
MLAQLDDDRLGHHLAPVNLRWLAPVDRGVPAHLPIAMNGHPEKTPAPIRCFTISSISAAVFFCLTTLHPLNAKSCPTCACCDDHERDRKHGADDVHVERDAGVAGREISRDHHLSDVTDRIAEQEDGGGADGRGLGSEFSPECNAGPTPMAKSAMPTSNWKGLTCHPI